MLVLKEIPNDNLWKVPNSVLRAWLNIFSFLNNLNSLLSESFIGVLRTDSSQENS